MQSTFSFALTMYNNKFLSYLSATYIPLCANPVQQ